MCFTIGLIRCQMSCHVVKIIKYPQELFACRFYLPPNQRSKNLVSSYTTRYIKCDKQVSHSTKTDYPSASNSFMYGQFLIF